MKLIRIVPLLFVVLFLTTIISVQAQCRRNCPPPPVATLEGEWTPSQQLTSIVDDTRTVELKMKVSSDRPIWAMDLSCLVSPVDVFESSGQTMIWSANWTTGNEATNFFDSTPDADGIEGGIQHFDAATDRINVTVTRVGATNAPIGYNGADYTEDLFTLQLTIAEGLTGTTNVSLNCDTVKFLDRNGNSLGVTTYDGSTLVLTDGYTIYGDVARQGNTDLDDFDVTCTHSSGREYESTPVVTNILDRKGRVIGQTVDGFQFNSDEDGDGALRDFGFYRCDYVSEVGGSENTVYLKGNTYLNLNTPNYTIQPVTLLGGDTNGDDGITVADLAYITANWQQEQTAYTQGDVNGDGFVDEEDLAIAAGNVGIIEDTNGVPMDHVIYSVARDYNDDFPNNTLVMGNAFAGAVDNLNAGVLTTIGSGRKAVTTVQPVRAFWPQVSPDGSRVVFFGKGTQTVTTGSKRNQVTTIVPFNSLMIANTESFTASTLADGVSLAPSWSPSGNQIAFICSWEETNSNGILGYRSNNGNLCVISASGGAVQTIMPTGAMSTYAEVFPPAWYDETTLVYAGNSDHPVCPDQICYYDMITDTHGKIAINGIANDATEANMPLIMPYMNDLKYLFYRAFDDSDSTLQMGTVSYDSDTNSWTASGVVTDIVDSTDFHQSVDGVDGIHYYDVSPMLDVMYYEFGDYQFHNKYFDADNFLWTDGPSHSVDNFIGYPMLQTFDSNVWDGYSESDYNATDFHAFRPTVDWLP